MMTTECRYRASQMAAVSPAKALVAWRLGEPLDPCTLAARPGVCVAKFDEFVVSQ